MRLRILTLNVQNDEGDPGRVDVLNRGLRAIEPDLVALQEVAYPVPGGAQLERLLAGTGLRGTHQADVLGYVPPYVDRYGGTAVASRRPYRVVEVLDPRTADAPDVPWCTLATSVALPDVGDLLFIATTAPWRLDAESARERQAVALTDLDARHRGVLPTVIAGDFNAGPDAASIRYLTGRQSLQGRSVLYHDGWAVAGDGPGHTWSCDNEAADAEMARIVRQPHYRRRLDYIFIGSWHAHPAAHGRIESARLAFTDPVDGVWPSDHFGVVIDIEIGPDE
jgi:endonuclease/exonuclease/phosphatase family metal-dependent hydrolase